MPTSSLLDCFCRLALTEELASLGWESRTGRGMAELAGLLAKGMVPRPWLRFGVPRIVFPDMMVRKRALLLYTNGS